jgi:6-pyruvoyltetrahydropterin/6-carboxytetrahydropterin synthase
MVVMDAPGIALLVFSEGLMHDAPLTHLSLVRQLRFCAGHRLYGHESKCAFFHGHNYRVDIEVEGVHGGAEVDSVGRIVDFSMIKRRMLGWLDDNWDHGFLIYEEDANALAAIRMVEPTKYFVMPYNPTAENMARYLLEVVSPAMLGDLGVVARRVTVWETEESCAVATLVGDPADTAASVATAVLVDHR